VTSPTDDLRTLIAGRAPTGDEGAVRQPSPARRGHLSPRARKTALTAHVAVIATWLGAVIANLFLGISAAVTDDETLADAYYASMDRLVNNLMPAAAIATLATGLLLALATRWGLLRHWWIIAKLVLAILTVVVGVTIIDPAISDTIRSRASTGSTGFSDALLPATAATPLMLVSATTIAITKPWGRTRRARRRATQAAPSSPGPTCDRRTL
jgi:uncharacterized membrane protein